jgi:serine/threonine-protein kinase
MGIVYAAHDERLDRPVAIKRLRPESQAGQERERLWREARTAASVSHPNICQLYEIDSEGDELFLTMELLDGEPLSARLARGPLRPNEAGQIALSVLSALGALHQKGIVHRDLKPSNIFLAQHGVKLLDFGLARPVAGALDASGRDLTMPGVVMGTPCSAPSSTRCCQASLPSMAILYLLSLAPSRETSLRRWEGRPESSRSTV